jgi:hypothetical protein
MGLLACRTYAIVCFFYGVSMIVSGFVFLYWGVFGIPPLVARLSAIIPITESERSYVPWLGGECLILGPVFIALGVFAYSRYISAMIVGCLIWMYMGSGFPPSFRLWETHWADVIHGDIDYFVIQLVAFVLLTVIAAIALRRSRSLPS